MIGRVKTAGATICGKVLSPWEPAAKPARSHGGLEAFGSHTPHSLDGGIAYKPLTRGWVLFTLSKRGRNI